MQVPGDRTSSERLLDFFGEYHVAMLAANPEFKDLAGAFEPAQTSLRGANETERKADRDVTRVLARRNYADFALDRSVRKFFFELLARNNNNRKAAEVAKLFPDGLDAVVGAPIAEEVKKVGALEAKLAEKKDPLYDGARAAISKDRAAIEKADKDLTTAVTAHGTAYGLERARRIDWIRQYTSNYGVLVSRLGRKSDAEIFFRRAERDEEAPAPEETAKP